ncbi:hypothetical protein K7X08_035261 [Anisodus acutangulus]|uniref:Pentatricopeptide repeat-containing protein n=1 Tax=Anisodus acutangulus TaxID=402998 RepID=A0A9Q1LIF4_9SOLA|nr:hypothetical protein K7X08_035261 [Anisodus acutangulus]
MILRHSLTGTWKHHRWKWSLRFRSTMCYNSNNAHPATSNVVSTNIAITKLAKKGSLDQARKLFDEIPVRTVVSWNTMVSGYSEWEKFSKALSLDSLMHTSYVKLNESTFSSALNARMVFDVLHRDNELLWSLMLVGYVKCNLLSDALEIFRKMPTRDIVAWTTLISGYSKVEGGCKKALELFRLMREDNNIVPNEFTLDCVLRVSGRLGSLYEGRTLHELVVKFGFEWDYSVSGALIDFYCNCEVLD